MHTIALPSFPFVVLDTETTGFVPKVDAIIEFAAVRMDNGSESARIEELFAVTQEIPPHIEVLTRIQSIDLQEKPSLEEKKEQIRSLIGEDSVIIGQNIGFDIGMLKAEGIDLTSYPCIDTSMLASLAFPGERSFSLAYLSQTLALPHSPVHRAMGDVQATIALLERCLNRLGELPQSMLQQAKDILSRSSEGHRILAANLPKGNEEEKKPAWLTQEESAVHTERERETTISIPTSLGTVTMLQDALDGGSIEGVLASAREQKGIRTWIAVKNIERWMEEHTVPEGARVLYPPFLLLDPEAKERLLAQASFSGDEATLALKLLWFPGNLRSKFPIHGDERSVWNGALACTKKSATYLAQCKDLPSIVILDHEQLLEILSDQNHPAKSIFSEQAHVIIDDASMMEDTATRAFGKRCDIDALRASGESNERMGRLAVLLQLWIEKTRKGQDMHMITSADLAGEETSSLLKHMEDLAGETSLTMQAKQQIQEIQSILSSDPQATILWMERRRNGSDILNAAPKHVALLLQEHLYKNHPTTIIVPPGDTKDFNEILGRETQTMITPMHYPPTTLRIHYEQKRAADDILSSPPEGKTMMLLGSKRQIEQAFVKHTQALEERGITLICQGLGGGQGRMEAEFLAAVSPAIWLLTPWTYEGVSLPKGTLEHLFIDALPFDHPGHVIIGSRSQSYKNAFRQYLLPRMEQRLFRVLRTFWKQAKPGGDVTVLDRRIVEREYGKHVRTYLDQFSSETMEEEREPKKKSPPKKEKKGPQMKLF